MKAHRWHPAGSWHEHIGIWARDGFEKDSCFPMLKAGLPQLLGKEAVLVLRQGSLLGLSFLDVFPRSANDQGSDRTLC